VLSNPDLSGLTLSIHPGCKKRLLEDCKSLYNNDKNFLGFPWIPQAGGCVVTWQETVCAAAREWEGTPYVPKGRVKGVGVDCGGFLYEVYNPICGTFPSMPDDYSADWSVHVRERTIPRLHHANMSTRSKSPEVGGFSLYHMGLNYAHAAILLENGRYIHAWGRLRSGRVTQTPIRVMNGMAKLMGNGFPVKHFTPKPELIKV
jgi:hypothetical protein